MDNSEAITVLRHMLWEAKGADTREQGSKRIEALELAIRALQDQEGRPAND